jgi:predicted nucleic acid-binding protein
VILDTSFLIALRERDEEALNLAGEMEAANLPTRIPTIVIWELYFGIGAGADRIENQRDYEALLANKPIVSLDASIARRAGFLMGAHRQSDSKKSLDPGDSIVAATGLVLNEPVVGRDGDFDDVEGLQIETY